MEIYFLSYLKLNSSVIPTVQKLISVIIRYYSNMYFNDDALQALCRWANEVFHTAEGWYLY